MRVALQFGVDFAQAVLQQCDAAGFAGARFAALARRVLERLPFGITQVWQGFHPRPAFGADAFGQFVQLAAHQCFQQRGIGQLGAAIVVGEQVAADAATRRSVGIHSDEMHQRVRCVDFAFRQTLAQCECAALPIGRGVERGFLRGVDYPARIQSLSSYLTPQCKAFLEEDAKQRGEKNELTDRVRVVYEIPGRG